MKWASSSHLGRERRRKGGEDRDAREANSDCAHPDQGVGPAWVLTKSIKATKEKKAKRKRSAEGLSAGKKYRGGEGHEPQRQRGNGGKRRGTGHRKPRNRLAMVQTKFHAMRPCGS